jgi:hypothetical protein
MEILVDLAQLLVEVVPRTTTRTETGIVVRVVAYRAFLLRRPHKQIQF